MLISGFCWLVCYAVGWQVRVGGLCAGACLVLVVSPYCGVASLGTPFDGFGSVVQILVAFGCCVPAPGF